MNQNTRVAIYGLGNMGYPLAERIGRHFATQVFDLDAAQRQRAQDSFGATAITGPEDVSATQTVVLCLPSPAVSLSVLAQIAPRLPRGAVVVETSTVNPEHIHAQHKLLAPYGVDLIDASIMAGVGQMVAGTASLALGGSPEAIARVQPVLDAIASRQTWFGALGAGAAGAVGQTVGQVAKIAGCRVVGIADAAPCIRVLWPEQLLGQHEHARLVGFGHAEEPEGFCGARAVAPAGDRRRAALGGGDPRRAGRARRGDRLRSGRQEDTVAQDPPRRVHLRCGRG